MKKLVAVNAHGYLIGESHQFARHPQSTIDRIWHWRHKRLGYRRISEALAREGLRVPWTTVRDIVKGITRGQKPARYKVKGSATDLTKRSPSPRVIVPDLSVWFMPAKKGKGKR